MPELEVSHQSREFLTVMYCTLLSLGLFLEHPWSWQVLEYTDSIPLLFILCFENLMLRYRSCPKPSKTHSTGETVSLPSSPSVETDTLTQFVLHLDNSLCVHWWQWVQLYLWWPKNSSQLTLHFKNWKISQKSILFFFFCFITFYSNNTQACRKHDG